MDTQGRFSNVPCIWDVGARAARRWHLHANQASNSSIMYSGAFLRAAAAQGRRRRRLPAASSAACAARPLCVHLHVLLQAEPWQADEPTTHQQPGNGGHQQLRAQGQMGNLAWPCSPSPSPCRPSPSPCPPPCPPPSRSPSLVARFRWPRPIPVSSCGSTSQFFIRKEVTHTSRAKECVGGGGGGSAVQSREFSECGVSMGTGG